MLEILVNVSQFTLKQTLFQQLYTLTTVFLKRTRIHSVCKT